MTTVNRAVREHLRRVLADEAKRTGRFLVRARAIGVLVFGLVTALLGAVLNKPDWAATLPAVAVYTSIAVGLAVASELVPRLLSISGLTVGLVDIPAATTISLLAIPFMRRPEYLLGSLVPMALVLVALSALSLDFLAIALASASAGAASVVLIVFIGAPLSECASPLLACLAAGVLMTFLVSKVRRLVEESRRRDFAGKYIIGERIGAGGMAEVFDATYSPAGGFERRVAIKRILPSFAADPEFVALFRREAELGAMLAHPNIVQVLDFGTDGSTYFLAMEFIDGLPLDGVLRFARAAAVPVPLSGVVALTRMMCEALDYLHTRTTAAGEPLRLVHRDVNPPNIMLSRLGDAKLGDFGVARASSQPRLTTVGTFRGKLSYAAPEQLKGLSFDSRADLFALGATLHELVTGQRLFRGSGEAAVAKAVVDAPIEPASALRPELPSLLDELILGLLQRDPAKRVQSAALAASALGALPAELNDVTLGRRELAGLVARTLSREPQAPFVARTGCLTDRDAERLASGELAPAEHDRWQQHLAMCPECGGLVAALAAAPPATTRTAPGRTTSSR